MSEQKQSLLAYESLLRAHRLLNKQLGSVEWTKTRVLSNFRNEVPQRNGRTSGGCLALTILEAPESEEGEGFTNGHVRFFNLPS